MREKWAYHLALSKKEIEGATLALLPGDPARVPKLAQSLDKKAEEIAWNREFRTCLGRMKGVPFVITSTGIGGPSTAIAVEELAMLGVRTFIRVGTCGGIQPFMKIGDVVITTGAVRQEGASTHYAPMEYPAVADFEVTSALIEGAKKAKVRYHIGITCSSDTFYPGQERNDSFSGYVPKRFQGITDEWKRLGVLNYEMEAATLLTVCSALRLRAGCITGVVDVRNISQHITLKALEKAEKNVVSVAGIGAKVFLNKILTKF